MRRILSLRLDEEASAVDAARLAGHQAACADCRGTEGLLLLVRGRLRDLAAGARPAGIGARVVRAALEDRILRLGRRRFLVRAAAASLLLAVGSGGLLAAHRPDVTTLGPMAERTKAAVIVPMLEQRR